MAIVQKNLIGIEIGTKNIKMVKVNSKRKVTNFTFVELPEKIIVNGRIESKQMLIETLKIAKRKLGTALADCALCFTSPDVVIRHISIPQMQESLISKNIMLELSGFLPMNPESYMIDYIITDTIDTEEKKLFQILVYAIPLEIVKAYASAVKSAGFNLKYIDIIENAYEKLFKLLKFEGIAREDNFACLYIDNSKASVSIYGNGRFFINKTIDTGINKLNEDIAEKTGKSLDAVKKMLYSIDVFTSVETFDVEKNMIMNYAKEVAYEVNRVIDYFKSQNRESSIGVIYFSGGFSHIKGIQAYLEEIIGIPVVSSSKFLDRMFINLPSKESGIDYTNAIAITLREEKTR